MIVKNICREKYRETPVLVGGYSILQDPLKTFLFYIITFKAASNLDLTIRYFQEKIVCLFFKVYFQISIHFPGTVI